MIVLSLVFSDALKYEGIDEDATSILSSLSYIPWMFAVYDAATGKFEELPFNKFLLIV